MARLVEIVLAAGMFALLLSPILALVAGVVMFLTGLAFIPVFAPLTTTLVLGFFAWAAYREARRKKRRTPGKSLV